MQDPQTGETTEILRASTLGDTDALRKLTPRVYRELRRMASHFLKNERVGYTLQATELVHEVYLRLVDVNQLEWRNKTHFFAIAATLMRRILVDRARRRPHAQAWPAADIGRSPSGRKCAATEGSRVDRPRRRLDDARRDRFA